MSLPCLWGDPALCHPSQPTTVNTSMQRLRSPELNRALLEILDRSWLSVLWHFPWKKNLRGAVFPHLALQFFRKQTCLSFTDFLYMHWHGNQGLSALWPHISSYPFAVWWLSVRASKVVLIVLMMCHSDVSHVRHGARLPARGQGEATGWCCVVL